MATNMSLLGSTSRIETPYVKVQIGDYIFGVFQKKEAKLKDEAGFYQTTKIIYPNYIQSLNVIKVNGQVNQYTLQIKYPITSQDDPNFFEKVFSSVSKSRKILFSYGDMSLPNYVYKNEEAIITKITTQFQIDASVIAYNISAVSSAALTKSGCYTFINSEPKKPSDEIKKLLYNKNYGLQEVFYGMNNKTLIEQKGLIASDDKAVQLETKTNISALDYLTYLVSCMVPASSDSLSVKQADIYIMTIIDDTTGEFGGPYFKIYKASSKVDYSDAYEIDIGFPTANVVTNFTIENNENYSIYYDWQKQLNNTEMVYRIDDSGNQVLEYAPIVSSKNNTYRTRVDDKTWWTKITEYPISATITIKGLLRPAILMSYVRLNVYFFGWKHISSGLYIVTKQVDNIDGNSGYKTTLSLTRIAGDNKYDY